jgi:hypothetical protein
VAFSKEKKYSKALCHKLVYLNKQMQHICEINHAIKYLFYVSEIALKSLEAIETLERRAHLYENLSSSSSI